MPLYLEGPPGLISSWGAESSEEEEEEEEEEQGTTGGCEEEEDAEEEKDAPPARDPLLQDSIQIHLKAWRGSIMVATCEVRSGDAVTSDPTEGRSFFLKLETSRIRTTAPPAEFVASNQPPGGASCPQSSGTNLET